MLGSYGKVGSEPPAARGVIGSPSEAGPDAAAKARDASEPGGLPGHGDAAEGRAGAASPQTQEHGGAAEAPGADTGRQERPKEAPDGKTGDRADSGGTHRTGRREPVWRLLWEQAEKWEQRLVALAVQVLRYRYATAALLLVAVAALYGAAALSRPSGGQAAAGAPRRVPVTSAMLACPAPTDGTVSVLTPPGGSGGTGRAEVSSLKDGKAVASITGTGTPWSKDVADGAGAYVIKARGALAGGLQAEHTSHRGSGADRGLAAVRCGEPGTDLWFVGPGPLAADRLELHLTNLDAQTAVVDLTALSGEGPLDTLDGRGLPIDPGSTRVVRIGDGPEGLGEIVQTAQVLALRVQATTGRVAAALRVRADDGGGVDWLPAAGAPATSLTVPGIPEGGGERRLLLAVPGQDNARVRIQVLTSSGAFAPEGRDTVDLPARTVTSVTLERALSGKAAAVRLTSDKPVVAGLAVARGDDVGYGTATAPLGATGGVVADNRFESVLLLTAPEREATVTVTTVDGRGRAGTPRQVRIPAGRTAQVEPSAPTGEKGFGVLIVPQPGSGPVHAARVLQTGRDGGLFTVLPVVPAVTTLLLPPVLDSQRVLIP